MRIRSSTWLVLVLAAIASSGAAWAETPKPPETYSISAPARSAREMSVKVYRDGPREKVEMSRANGWKAQFWYDFAAHKEYVLDSSDPAKRCSVQKYASDHAPGLQDPIDAALEMGAQLPATAKVVGHETVGGLAARVVEVDDPDEHGKMKAWIDEKYGLLLKLVFMPEKGPAQTTFELGQINFAKPDAALLKPPSGCTVVAGESNANGGHTEVPAQTGTGANPHQPKN